MNGDNGRPPNLVWDVDAAACMYDSCVGSDAGVWLLAFGLTLISIHYIPK